MKGSQTAILIVVLLLIGGLIVAKSMRGDKPGAPVAPVAAAPPEAPTPMSEPATPEPPSNESLATASDSSEAEASAGKSLPKMLELMGVGCQPCAHMAPIIEGLREELQGKVDIEAIDVSQNAAVAEQYQVMAIPTQVFLDAAGKELFRHTGVFEKPDILAKLRELGMLKE